MKPCEYGCGTEVTFVLLGVKDERNVWSPPVERTERKVCAVADSAAFALDKGYVVTERFQVHVCEQGDKAKQAAREHGQQQYAIRADTARRKVEAWAEALKRPCPKCQRSVDTRCVNLRKQEANTAWPHAERLPEGWTDR